MQSIKLSDLINTGLIRDYPDRAERSFFVDNGRQYFTIKWLENHIRELAYLKMNYFDFYLGDNEDFRLQCDTYPEITSKEHYTKDDIRNLQKLAKKYHITIVPVLNMPGHMGAMIRPFQKEIALKNMYGGIAITFLDITLDSARSFVVNILNEYLDLFEGPYWHMGADEYIYNNFENFPQFENYAKMNYGATADPIDAINDFINWVNSIVRKRGKTLRIYNDVMSVVNSQNIKTQTTIDKNIVIDFWEGKDGPNWYIENGYKICNAAQDFLYYNTGQGWIIYNPNFYKWWYPSIYNGHAKVQDNHPSNLGAKFHIWCNVPYLETEGHIANEIRNTLRILSHCLWGGPKLVDDYYEFLKICADIGLAPGVQFPENPMPGNIAWKKNVTTSSQRLDTILPPSFVVDGSYNSRWSSLSNRNEWLIVDLDTVYKVDLIKIAWIMDQPEQFKVSVSKDGVKWNEKVVQYSNDRRFTHILNANDTARYLKIDFVSTKDSIFTIWELEAHGEIYHDSTIIDSILDYSQLEIFPNPATNNININLPDDVRTVKSIHLCNMLGDNVLFLQTPLIGKSGKLSIELKNIVSGVYNLIVDTDKGKITSKVIILKN